MKALALLINLVGVLWLGIAGGGLIWWYDRRPAGVPRPVEVRVLFFHWSLGLPLSLGAQRDAALTGLQDALRRAKSRDDALEVANADLSKRLSASDQAAQTRIETRTRVLIKEVPYAITPATDRRFPLPVGLVRVHDAAALGCGDLSCVPLAPGQSDDSPSPVETSRLGSVIAANYGECASASQRLTDLQAWVRGEHDASLKVLEIVK